MEGLYGGVIYDRPRLMTFLSLKEEEEKEEEKSNVMGISWRNCFMRENRSAKVEHDRFSREQTQRTETPHDVLLWTHNTHTTPSPHYSTYISSLFLFSLKAQEHKT